MFVKGLFVIKYCIYFVMGFILLEYDGGGLVIVVGVGLVGLVVVFEL